MPGEAQRFLWVVRGARVIRPAAAPFHHAAGRARGEGGGSLPSIVRSNIRLPSTPSWTRIFCPPGCNFACISLIVIIVTLHLFTTPATSRRHILFHHRQKPPIARWSAGWPLVSNSPTATAEHAPTRYRTFADHFHPSGPAIRPLSICYDFLFASAFLIFSEYPERSFRNAHRAHIYSKTTLPVLVA